MYSKNSDEIILVTGAAGFIGSHTVVVLIENGYDIVIIDNLSNSHEIVLDRISSITNIRPKFYKGDVRDKALINKIFSENKIDAVIHFAGLKSIEESLSRPEYYHENNVEGASTLLSCMKSAGVNRFIFSSSATVYGEPNYLPIDEEHKRSTGNPYGRTKLEIEDILISLSKKNPEWSISILRYFNPIGAHSSGLIGENSKGFPDNLISFITNVALGNIDELKIYGNDYPTKDGTGIRDYIHVVDLAEGHLRALKHNEENLGTEIFNLGIGKGTSVLELLKIFEKVNKVKIPYAYHERRSGDVFSSIADVSKAKKILKWKAIKGIKNMCEDNWRWKNTNPN